MTPPPGRTKLTVDASFTREGFGQFTDADRPVGDAAEIDMLFVLHGVGDDTQGGPGMSVTWAARAQPGERVALWGPRTIYEPPADTDWLSLIAGETGLPAVCVILENLPDGIPARVLLELGEAADRLSVPEGSGIHLTWLSREDPPGGSTSPLVEAVRALDRPKGNVYAWGGAEARTMAIRKHLQHGRNIDRTRVRMTGYWRHASTPARLDTDARGS